MQEMVDAPGEPRTRLRAAAKRRRRGQSHQHLTHVTRRIGPADPACGLRCGERPVITAAELIDCLGVVDCGLGSRRNQRGDSLKM